MGRACETKSLGHPATRFPLHACSGNFGLTLHCGEDSSIGVASRQTGRPFASDEVVATSEFDRTHLNLVVATDARTPRNLDDIRYVCN
jgi:hypothetical protein